MSLFNIVRESLTSPLNAIFARPSKSAAQALQNVIHDPFAAPGTEREDVKHVQRQITNSVVAQVRTLLEGFEAKEIEDWSSAVSAALMQSFPRRMELEMLYKNALIDDALHTVARTRRERLLGSKWRIVPAANKGETDDARTQKLEGVWFENLMGYIHDAIYYGHSLIQVSIVDNKPEIFLIPRANVVPRYGEFLANPYDTEGISYLSPQYESLLLEVGTWDDLGLLQSASLAVMKKKASDKAWLKFQSIFGMPMRVATTDSKNKVDLAKIDQFLEDMGDSAWARFPEGTKLQLIENARTDAYKVFSIYMDRQDAAITRLFFGGNMVIQDGSSRAQATVHDELADDILKADKRYVKNVINEKLFPLLIANGWTDLVGYVFDWDEPSELSILQQWTIDESIIKLGYDVPIDYLSNRYNTPIAAAPVKPQPLPLPPQAIGAQPSPRITTLAASADVASLINEWDAEDLQKAYDKALRKLHREAKKGNTVTFDSALWKEFVAILQGGVTDGYTIRPEYDTTDDLAKSFLLENVAVFSAAKTYDQLRVLTDLLYDGDRLRSFAEFRSEALKIYETYNKSYLNAEYNQAVAASQASSLWQDIQRNKEALPLLIYDAVQDRRTRPDHAMLDGICRRVDDPFWDKYYPPLGWNCRCTITQIAEADVTPDGKLPSIALSEMFSTNVGKTGIIFPDTHPYYEAKGADHFKDLIKNGKSS